MLIDRYLDHLAYEKRCSVHTVAAYKRDLGQFQAFMERNGAGGIEHATDRTIRTWMMGLMEEGQSPSSVNRKLSALRGFYRFARVTGSVAVEPSALVDAPRMPKRLPEFVEEQRMDRLFEAQAWPEGYPGDLHRLMMELLYGTGMRLAELLGLKVADVSLRTGTLKVLGKRNKERIIPIGPQLVARIGEHLRLREQVVGPFSPSDALLVDEQAKPMARRSVQRLVVHYLSGVTSQQKRSPHVLRHTFATHMLEHGADLNAVKELLGHAGLAATQVYTHNTVEKLRKVHANAHPRGGGQGINNEHP
jgi:integrase/recombinase XerC